MSYLAGAQLLLCGFATKRYWYSIWEHGTLFHTLEKCKAYLVASDNYWSSSPNVSDPSKAWNVNFKNGNDNWNNKSNANLVRCVRESKNYV